MPQACARVHDFQALSAAAMWRRGCPPVNSSSSVYTYCVPLHCIGCHSFTRDVVRDGSHVLVKRAIVPARTTAVVRVSMGILHCLQRCLELGIFALHCRQPRPERVLEVVYRLGHVRHRHQSIPVGIEQGAVWARRRVPQRTELDVHVPNHSNRSDVTERARECERGGHLLHWWHHYRGKPVHKGLHGEGSDGAVG